MKPTHRKSWAWNLLMLNLTFGPSFKVKQWFTGFGDLSFQWIQICIGSPMRRSSSVLEYSRVHGIITEKFFAVKHNLDSNLPKIYSVED